MEVLWAWLVIGWGPPRPCQVLAAIDVVRAEAWERSDPDLLTSLYAPGAGDADVARLTAWDDRGVRLSGVRMVRSSCSARDGSTAVVVERLGPTVAHLPGGAQRLLPADDWSRRTVTVGRVDGRWRIVQVR